MKLVELKIGGMSCGHCVEHVSNALREVAGVQSVQVSLTAQLATLQVDEAVFNLDEASEAINEAGYEFLGQLS